MSPAPKFFVPFAALFLASCTALQPELAELTKQPLTAERQTLGDETWSFAGRPGHAIKTTHYNIYTTVNDPLLQHLLVRVLEATHDRVSQYNPDYRSHKPFDCYIFATRAQWERFTREHGGDNAPLYLQIPFGGYSQDGVFVGYDIGRDQTLSVVAHEAFHQYSWFAFKDHLPSWLEEGLATQNEALEWHGADPTFNPEANYARLYALRQALRTHHLFPLSELLSTHAGRIIKLSQASIDAYYAQLWSFVLFLQRSPTYAPRLQTLLSDAGAGRLTAALADTTVTRSEINNFTEHWNSVAGPLYLQKYVNPDLAGLEREYLAWARQFAR